MNPRPEAANGPTTRRGPTPSGPRGRPARRASQPKNPRKRLIILACLAITGGVLAFFYFTRTPPAAIYGIAPIGPDEAILLSSHSDPEDWRDRDKGMRYFVELSRTDGTLVWAHETSPFETFGATKHVGVAADTERVYLLQTRRGESVLVALSRRDGNEIWRQPLSSHETFYAFRKPLYLDGGRLIVADSSKDIGSVTIRGFDAATGRSLWTVPEPIELDMLSEDLFGIIAPGRVFVACCPRDNANCQRGTSGIEVDTRTGQLVGYPPIGRGFVSTHLGVVGITQDAFTFFPKEGEDIGPPHTLELHKELTSVSDRFVVGAYENLVIVGLEEWPLLPRRKDSRLLIGVNPLNGEIKWRRELPNTHSYVPMVDTRSPLPRMLPLSLFNWREPDGEKHGLVVVIDLATGDLLSEEPGWTKRQLCRAGDHVVEVDEERKVLGAFEPTSGKFRPAPAGTYTLEPTITAESLRYGRLWFWRGWSGKPGALPWTVIDIPSWRTLHEHGSYDD